MGMAWLLPSRGTLLLRLQLVSFDANCNCCVLQRPWPNGTWPSTGPKTRPSRKTEPLHHLRRLPPLRRNLPLSSFNLSPRWWWKIPNKLLSSRLCPVIGWIAKRLLIKTIWNSRHLLSCPMVAISWNLFPSWAVAAAAVALASVAGLVTGTPRPPFV